MLQVVISVKCGIGTLANKTAVRMAGFEPITPCHPISQRSLVSVRRNTSFSRIFLFVNIYALKRIVTITHKYDVMAVGLTGSESRIQPSDHEC